MNLSLKHRPHSSSKQTSEVGPLLSLCGLSCTHGSLLARARSMQAIDEWLDRAFLISRRGSTTLTELRAGLTTFMTMA
jgi:hypothetical protein